MSACGISMRKGRIASLIALLLVIGGRRPGRAACDHTEKARDNSGRVSSYIVGSCGGDEVRDHLGQLFALVLLQEVPGPLDGGVQLPGGAGHAADEHALAAPG